MTAKEIITNANVSNSHYAAFVLGLMLGAVEDELDLLEIDVATLEKNMMDKGYAELFVDWETTYIKARLRNNNPNQTEIIPSE